jgi:hypothetical protein
MQLFVSLRALQGVLISCHTLVLYRMFFNWVRPLLPLLLACVASDALQADSNADRAVERIISVAALKLICELYRSRANRIAFPPGDAGSLQLYHLCSESVRRLEARMVATGARGSPTALWHQYQDRVVLVVRAFGLLLESDVVAFGAMYYYGDISLVRSISTCVRWMSCHDPTLLLSYPRCARAFYRLLRLIVERHLSLFLRDTLSMSGESSIATGLAGLQLGQTHTSSSDTGSAHAVLPSIFGVLNFLQAGLSTIRT